MLIFVAVRILIVSSHKLVLFKVARRIQSTYTLRPNNRQLGGRLILRRNHLDILDASQHEIKVLNDLLFDNLESIRDLLHGHEGQSQFIEL